MPYHLNQDEIDSCRKSFDEFDADRSGTIDEFELAEIPAAMGYQLTEEEIFRLISQHCDAIAGQVVFSEFLVLIAKLKDNTALLEDQSDMQLFFAACGGNEDGTGMFKQTIFISYQLDRCKLSNKSIYVRYHISLPLSIPLICMVTILN